MAINNSVNSQQSLTSSDDVAFNIVTLNGGDPTSANQAATKNYVDSANSQIMVYAASTANIAGTYNNGSSGVGATFTLTATGAFTLDGATPNVGYPVLLKNQSTAYQNGIYILTTQGTGSSSAVLTRAIYYDQPSNINWTGIITVSQGSVNANTAWQLNAIISFVGQTIQYVQSTVNLFNNSTARQVFLSQSNSAPIWSTATYPSTTTANQLLYSSAANTIGGLSTANNGVLTTNSSGVPSISTTLPSAVQSNITQLGAVTSGSLDGVTIGATTPVQAQIYKPISAQNNTAYTYVLTDNGKMISHNNASAITVTIPPHSSVAFPLGAEIDNEQAGTAQVTFAAGAGVTLTSYLNLVKTAGQNAAVTAKQTLTQDTWRLYGNMG